MRINTVANRAEIVLDLYSWAGSDFRWDRLA